MKIKIYKGTKEIGGTCIEISADNGKIIWIDLGTPLNLENPDTSYRNNKVDALLISHPHQDHFGLMESVGKEVPVFIGQVSEDLIKATKRFLGVNPPQCNFKRFTPWKEIKILDTFSVYPYLMDHSSPEAFAFLIEVDGKRIFYSGDFRSTGRKKVLFEKLIKLPPKDVDLLLIEGTMIERSNQQFPTEGDVETAIYEIVKNLPNMTFVVSAAQNIDRFCSVFNVCLKTNKMLIIDVYMAWVLETVSKKSKGLPTIDSGRVLVYNNQSQIDKITGIELTDFNTRVKSKSIHDGIFTKPEKFIYFLRCPNEKLIDKLSSHGIINLIYSQWPGYLEEAHKTYATEIINSLRQSGKVLFSYIHTSGHATLKELKELAKAIDPKIIVPIHSDNPEKMKLEFSNSGFNNIVTWMDGMDYSL